MGNLSNVLRHAIRNSIYVLLLLALIQPFGIDTLKEGRILFILCETAMAFISTLIAAGVVSYIVSFRKDEQTTLKQFITTRTMSMLINVPLLAAMLLTFNGWFNLHDWTYFWFWDGHFTLYHVMVMSTYVFVISVFIYIFDFFCYRNNKLQYELAEIRSINELLEKRQEKLQQESIDTKETQKAEDVIKPESSPTIKIVGQGQGSVLEVNPNNIIFVESMANYTHISYIANNETKHATLRITLKQVRETLENIDCIIQCHRAYLVNINFVASLNNRNSSYQLEIFGMDKPIPVSRANTEAIKTLLNKS